MARSVMQISVVVKDIQKTMEKYVDLWGVEPWEIHIFNPSTVKEFIVNGKSISDFEFLLAVSWIGNVQIELIQPVKGPNIYKDFLDQNGEGVHHLKEYVEDSEISKILKEYEEKGISMIQSGRYDNDVFYYLDTKAALGFLLEIGNNGKVREPVRWYPSKGINKNV
jgi:methylmalonyl-CoA/ethylmalonyl-CoA epimerase